MFASVLAVAALGTVLGALLGLASRLLKPADEDPIVERISDVLPGSQCGQCGFPGCGPAAAAVAAGEAPVTLCPPGGRAVAEKLAEILGTTLEAGSIEEREPEFAHIRRELCIGCTRCIKACPTDAIVGANKQLHVVLTEACIGCRACHEVCPTAGIDMEAIPVTLRNWRWAKPELAAA